MHTQHEVINLLYEVTKGAEFSLAHQNIGTTSRIKLFRRGAMLIKANDGFMGRALFRVTGELGQKAEIVSVPLSVPFSVQNVIPIDGKIVTEGTYLHKEDLAVRHMNLQVINGVQDNLILIGTDNKQFKTPDGNIIPFEIRPNWVPSFEKEFHKHQATAQAGRVVRHIQERRILAVRDFGEVKPTWNMPIVEGGELRAAGIATRSVIELTERLMVNKFVTGFHPKSPHEIMEGRLKQLGYTMLEVASYRKEEFSESNMLGIVEQSLETLYRQEEVKTVTDSSFFI